LKQNPLKLHQNM